jgi:O-antigen ligase
MSRRLSVVPRRAPRSSSGQVYAAGRAASLLAWALAVVLVGSALAVDPRAEAAFDAPKRLVTLLGIAMAAVVMVWATKADTWRRRWRSSPPVARLAAIAAGTGLAGMAVAAVMSPRPAPSMDTVRTALVMALLLPLGACDTLDDRHVRYLGGGLVVAATLNAGLSLLQLAGVYQPFRVAATAGRSASWALVGNEGLMALTLAMACVVCLGAALSAPGTRWRRTACVTGSALAMAILASQTVTAVLAVLAGAVVTLALLVGSRAWRFVGWGVLVATLGAVTVSPFRARILDVVSNAWAGDWSGVVSERLIPWAAAADMIRERPLLGWGPGTFGAELVTHRLAAEIRLGARLVTSKPIGSFSEAHNDLLQAAAEDGLPTAMAFAVAAAALGLGTIVKARRATGEQRAELGVLAGILTSGAVASLLWFPMMCAVTAAPLLLAAGRAWRLQA